MFKFKRCNADIPTIWRTFLYTIQKRKKLWKFVELGIFFLFKLNLENSWESMSEILEWSKEFQLSRLLKRLKTVVMACSQIQRRISQSWKCLACITVDKVDQVIMHRSRYELIKMLSLFLEVVDRNLRHLYFNDDQLAHIFSTVPTVSLDRNRTKNGNTNAWKNEHQSC